VNDLAEAAFSPSSEEEVMAGNNSHASGAAGLNSFVGTSPLSLACEEKRRATSPDMKL
jgi:hypothetical protein